MTNKYIVRPFMVFNSRLELIRDLCSIECPECKHEMTVAKDGWSAIVCLGCKAELYLKHKAPKELTNGQ